MRPLFAVLVHPFPCVPCLEVFVLWLGSCQTSIGRAELKTRAVVRREMFRPAFCCILHFRCAFHPHNSGTRGNDCQELLLFQPLPGEVAPPSVLPPVPCICPAPSPELLPAAEYENIRPKSLPCLSYDFNECGKQFSLPQLLSTACASNHTVWLGVGQWLEKLNHTPWVLEAEERGERGCQSHCGTFRSCLCFDYFSRPVC